MTSFGWKRKAGQGVSKSKSKSFEKNARNEDDELEELEDGHIDWLTLAQTKKVFTLEDAKGKSKRLRNEGEVLAEAERFWEAIKKWDSALQLTPDVAALYDMKAQAYLNLNEPLLASATAQRAVEREPNWWMAHQTLGRAHLNLGEVRLALQSFSRAVHLSPDDEELWKEDFLWSHQLWQQYLRNKDMATEEEEQSAKIVELSEESDAAGKGTVALKQRIDPNLLLPVPDAKSHSTEAPVKTLKNLPKNMVLMRN